MSRIIGQGMKKKVRELKTLHSAFAIASGVLDYFYPKNETRPEFIKWPEFIKRFVVAPIIVGTIATASYYALMDRSGIDEAINPDNTLIVQADIQRNDPHMYTIIIKDGVAVENAGNKVKVYEERKQGEFRLVDNSLTASQIVHLLKYDIQNHPERVQGVTGGLSPAIAHIASTLRELNDPIKFQLDQEAIDHMTHMLSKAEATIRAEGYQPQDETGRYSLANVFCNLTVGSMSLCLISIILSAVLKGRLERRIKELEHSIRETKNTRRIELSGFGGGGTLSPHHVYICTERPLQDISQLAFHLTLSGLREDISQGAGASMKVEPH